MKVRRKRTRKKIRKKLRTNKIQETKTEDK